MRAAVRVVVLISTYLFTCIFGGVSIVLVVVVVLIGVVVVLLLLGKVFGVLVV